jgi:uncharacterized protein YbbK (DUF523 family)
MKSKLLVSACLMGFQVRYNGSESTAGGDAVPLAAGGAAGDPLPGAGGRSATPRLPAEILGGAGGDVLPRARIVESDGRDVTGHYQLAAWLALSAAREAGCQAALLTDGSPPAAASLSMTVPFADSAKRAPAWPPTCCAPGITVFSDGQIPQLLAWMAQKEQDDDSM